MANDPADRPIKTAEELVEAIKMGLRSMHKWRSTLKPAIDKAVDDLKADGHLSTAFSDAVEDFGKYCLTKAIEIRAERARLGIGARKKLPPAKY